MMYPIINLKFVNFGNSEKNILCTQVRYIGISLQGLMQYLNLGNNICQVVGAPQTSKNIADRLLCCFVFSLDNYGLL